MDSAPASEAGDVGSTPTGHIILLPGAGTTYEVRGRVRRREKRYTERYTTEDFAVGSSLELKASVAVLLPPQCHSKSQLENVMATEWNLLRKAKPGKEDELHQLYIEYHNVGHSGCLFSFFPRPAQKDIEVLRRRIDEISTDDCDFLRSKTIGQDEIADRVFRDEFYGFNHLRVEHLKLLESDPSAANWLLSADEALEKYKGRNLYDVAFNEEKSMCHPYSSLLDSHFMVSRWSDDVRQVIQPLDSKVEVDPFTDDLASIKNYAASLKQIACQHLRSMHNALKDFSDEELCALNRKIQWGHDIRESDNDFKSADDWIESLPTYERMVLKFWGPLCGSQWLLFWSGHGFGIRFG